MPVIETAGCKSADALLALLTQRQRQYFLRHFGSIQRGKLCLDPKCRKGENCGTNALHTSAAMHVELLHCCVPPAVSELDLPRRYVDVETVETDDGLRLPVQVALLSDTETVFNSWIGIPEGRAVRDWKTPFTGLRCAADLRAKQPVPHNVAMQTIRSAVRGSALVGWGVHHDAGYLAIREGAECALLVDIASWFRFYEKTPDRFSHFKLSTVARQLLPAPVQEGDTHCALEDARATRELFLKFARSPEERELARRRLLAGMREVE
eukprot:TRINITY_DN20436_c0_g2_i1.p1 TRINITY_DN20436_c0_g2~~TRINITY_DN20436_c0_g2_i1.p1  ORF type:complete len:266 (-),score=47.83 TRINITY_DN20436_c0_g2_i1:31-828(-)